MKVNSVARLFDVYGHHIGVGLSTLITVFEPAHVVLGGGAARYFDLYEAELRRALVRSNPFASVPDMCVSRLGAQAGALGAALLAQRSG